MLTVELERRGAARYASRTAVRCGDESMTFAEVDAAANQIAHVLAGLGVIRGDRVGLLIGNGIWSIPVDFGCLKAGAARVPLNTRLAAAEQARMLAATGVRLLVHGPDMAGRAAELAAQVGALRLVSLGPAPEADAADLLEEMKRASSADPRVRAEPGDAVLVLYTSGTTGALKAVEHSQASFAAITANILANLISPGRDSVMLHAASLIHASGTFVLPYWIRGGCAAVLPGFDPATYLEDLARYRATEINLVPTMFGMLAGSGAAERADVSSLRAAVYGASPMPRPLLEQMLDLWGPRLVQYFGQTEAPLAITALDADDHRDPTLLGSCGHPSVDAEVLQHLIPCPRCPGRPGTVGLAATDRIVSTNMATAPAVTARLASNRYRG